MPTISAQIKASLRVIFLKGKRNNIAAFHISSTAPFKTIARKNSDPNENSLKIRKSPTKNCTNRIGRTAKSPKSAANKTRKIFTCKQTAETAIKTARGKKEIAIAKKTFTYIAYYTKQKIANIARQLCRKVLCDKIFLWN